VWSVDNPGAAAALRVMFAFGWMLVLVATFLIDHFDLFGLRQVSLYLMGRPYTARPFATPGPYRLIRHPLYAGWFLAFRMTPTMSGAHLMFAVATTTYILLAIPI
jgi:protein-S-isoprenylcysteine O-methyltransferase Ste14